MAHTLVYDTIIMGDYSLPVERAAAVEAPTLALAGGESFPFMREAARKLAEAIPDALPETFSKEKIAAVDSRFQEEAAFQGLIESLGQMRMRRRSPRLKEVAATAAFLASEKAAAITGTFVNVTSGTFSS